MSLDATDVIALNCLELDEVIPEGKCWKAFIPEGRGISLVTKSFVLEG